MNSHRMYIRDNILHDVANCLGKLRTPRMRSVGDSGAFNLPNGIQVNPFRYAYRRSRDTENSRRCPYS